MSVKAVCPTCGKYIDDGVKKQKTSQENKLFHALCQRISAWQRWPFDVTKRYVKLYACVQHGYDCESIDVKGVTYYEPKSVADATNEDMINKLIPSAYEVGFEIGCPLEQTEVYNEL